MRSLCCVCVCVCLCMKRLYWLCLWHWTLENDSRRICWCCFWNSSVLMRIMDSASFLLVLFAAAVMRSLWRVLRRRMAWTGITILTLSHIIDNKNGEETNIHVRREEVHQIIWIRLPSDNSTVCRLHFDSDWLAWIWRHRGKPFEKRPQYTNRIVWVPKWNPLRVCLMLPCYWMQWTIVHSRPIESKINQRICVQQQFSRLDSIHHIHNRTNMLWIRRTH